MPQLAPRQNNKRKDSIGEPLERSSAKRPDLEVESDELQHDYSKKRDKDPVIDQMVKALVSKLPQEISDAIDSDKRARSLVISGLPEPQRDLRPSAKQADLESKISDLMDLKSCSLLGPFELQLLQIPTDCVILSSLVSLNGRQPTHGVAITDLILSPTRLLSDVTILPPFASSDHNMVAFQIQVQPLIKLEYLSLTFIELTTRGYLLTSIR
ncbi:hypothetical protein COOONC_06913 [Cooperia oncophora]